MSPQSLQRAWKTKPWMRLLSGLTLKPSMQSRGVDAWISSLRDIRASHFPSPEQNAQKKTRATSGHTYGKSCAQSSQESAFSKTSPTIYDWGSNKSTMTYDQWITALRRVCLQRKKSVRRTSVNGFLSWRTVKATEAMGGCLSYQKFKERLDAGMPLSLRDQVKHMWPTVRVSSSNGASQNEINQGNPKRRLENSAVMWPTVTATDSSVNKARPPEKMIRKDGRNVLRTPSLAETVMQSKDFPYTKQDLQAQKSGKNYKTAKVNWPTPLSRDWKDTPNMKPRKTGQIYLSETAYNCGRQVPAIPNHGDPSQMRLNPLFTEWLMGWPIGWTEFAPVETAWCHWLRHMRLELSLLLLIGNHEKLES